MVTRDEGITTVLEPRPMPNFVETRHIRDIADRALAYIEAGFPIHFRGVSGTGKTTLALHVASKLGRPVVIIHGDDEFSTSDLAESQPLPDLHDLVDINPDPGRTSRLE
jgi:gas vesicle protein GvpN